MKLRLKMSIVAVLCILMVPWQVWAESTYNFKEKSPTNSALRSLILPGWGQLLNEQPTKVLIFAGAEAISIGTAFIMYSKANSTYDEYEEKRTDALYDDYSSQIDTANMFVYLSAGIWVWNVVDAYLSGGDPVERKEKRKNKEEDEEDWDSKAPLHEKINMQMTRNNEVFLTYTHTF